jgi:phosphate-selective porin OprO/OprP
VKIRSWGVLPAALATALLAGGAAADDVGQAGAVAVPQGGTVVEQLLDIMLASGQITREQYDALRAKAAEEQAAAAAAVARAASETPAVAEAGPEWDFKWSNGFKLERSDGAFDLAFGGRIMLDSASIWEDPELRGTIGGEGQGVEFRRARLFFEGTVYDRVIFKAQYDFADGPVEFKDVYLGLKDLGPVNKLMFGHFKEPFFLEEVTSSKYLTFMERGLNNVFFPGRNVGGMAQGNLLDKRALWQAGLFYETDDQGFGFNDWGDQLYDLALRVVGVPLYDEEGARVLHLGAGYIHQFRNASSSTLRYRQRPESHLAQRFVDTQIGGVDIEADDTNVFDIELATVLGRFSAQAEFTGSQVDRRGGGNPFFWGAYGYVSWFLTGEHRNYDLGKGRFGRIKPAENFNPFRGEWGAWEVAARYSYLDLTDAGVRGGEMWDVTAGLNWYLYPNLRVMLNYIHSDVTNRQLVAAGPDIDGNGNIFQTRFQIDF